nr:MAG TPA: Ead/Ea22-like protein [Bacteriophage sp.]
MTDITELAQALKAAAEKATPGNWRAFQYHDGRCGVGGGNHDEIMVCEHISKKRPHDAEFIAMANPANVRALVEALEKAQIAGSINNQWKPDVCPITGRRFFMWIEHPEFGCVPTYGGPYDSYTIPTRDSDGEFSCERYDHDIGGWVDGECVGAYLIDDDEQCRVYELEQRISDLESRAVKLPKKNIGWDRDEEDCWNNAIDACAEVLTAAGIKVEAE